MLMEKIRSSVQLLPVEAAAPAEMDPGLDQLPLDHLWISSVLLMFWGWENAVHIGETTRRRGCSWSMSVSVFPRRWDDEVPGFAILVADRQVERKTRDASERQMQIGRRSDSRRYDASEPEYTSATTALRR